MGRTVIADESVRDKLCIILPPKQIHTGLLIGQVTESKDLVAFTIKTPSLNEFDPREGEDRTRSENDLFVDWWVAEHATQVCGILPGGLSVIGLYICCGSSEYVSSIQARLGKVLCDIANQEFKGHIPHQHLSLVYYCPIKKRLKCQTIDSGSKQASFRPAELKFKDHTAQWTKIVSHIAINTEHYIPPEDTSPGVLTPETANLSHSLVQMSVRRILDSLQEAMVTLHGHIIQQDDELLMKHCSSSDKPQQNSTQVVRAEFYLKNFEVDSFIPVVIICGYMQPYVDSGPPHLFPQARKVIFKGTMSLLAYVHPKATCIEAIAAIKQDACRSLLSRVQAMIESSSQGGNISNQLPTRLILSIPTFIFPFTEYLLPHESTEESCSRASELLGATKDSIAAEVMEVFSLAFQGRDVELKNSVLGSSSSVFHFYSGVVSVIATITVVIIASLLWIVTNY